jgi:uncharacterized surface protein with fasciclin (FAS1) repeats
MYLGQGPFTVFAPSNAAFATLNKTIDIGTLSANAISTVLAYHVIQEEILMKNIKTGFLKALNGDDVYVNKLGAGGQVVLNGNAFITKSDLVGSNGVIHIIDNGKDPFFSIANCRRM